MIKLHFNFFEVCTPITSE